MYDVFHPSHSCYNYTLSSANFLANCYNCVSPFFIFFSLFKKKYKNKFLTVCKIVFKFEFSFSKLMI